MNEIKIEEPNYFFIYIMHNPQNLTNIKFGITTDPLKRQEDLNVFFSEKTLFINLFLFEKTKKYSDLNLYKDIYKTLSPNNINKILKLNDNTIKNNIKYLIHLKPCMKTNSSLINLGGYETLYMAIKHDLQHIGLKLIHEYTNLETTIINTESYKEYGCYLNIYIEYILYKSKIKYIPPKSPEDVLEDILDGIKDDDNVLNILS